MDFLLFKILLLFTPVAPEWMGVAGPMAANPTKFVSISVAMSWCCDLDSRLLKEDAPLLTTAFRHLTPDLQTWYVFKSRALER